MTQPCLAADGVTKFGRDQTALVQLLRHLAQTDWFEYHAGSRVAHFRFPARYQKIARDGVPIYFEKPGPSTKGSQPRISNPGVREQTQEKIAKVLQRRYLCAPVSPVKSFIKYFGVPKGEDDVRMVYYATANDLNECVWSPSFWLPTINTLL